MTNIAVKYKRNTTGEDIPPPSGYMVRHTRPDGRPANEGEVFKMNKAFNRAMAGAGEKAEETGQFVEPEWADGGYQIEVLREDDLPLSIHDVQCLVYLDLLRRREEMQDVEVITISKATHAIVSNLPPDGVQAWANALQQLEPVQDRQEQEDEDTGEDDKFYEQVVTLCDAEGAQALLDAGLICRYDAGRADQYIVPRASAYCMTEWRRG